MTTSPPLQTTITVASSVSSPEAEAFVTPPTYPVLVSGDGSVAASTAAAAPRSTVLTTASVAPNPTTVDDDADSSEYETDPEGSFEEFFITLDLTIPAPVKAGPSTNPYTNTSLPPRPSSTPHGPRDKTTAVLGASRQHQHLPSRVPQWARTTATPTSSAGQFQLLDLATENPLIGFQNRIWAGHWTRPIGTELYIDTPGTVPATASQVDDQPGATARRRTGGGYYVPTGDSSDAAAYIGGTRGPKPRVVARPSEYVDHPEKYVDGETGRIIGVAAARVHAVPTIVKAKEWPFKEQLKGKSDFYRRLNKVQVEKGEVREPRRRRRKRKHRRVRAEGSEGGDVGEGEGEGEGGGEGSGEESGSGSTGSGSEGSGEGSEEDEEENDRREEEEGRRKEALTGYFTPGWEKEKGVAEEKEKDKQKEATTTTTGEKSDTTSGTAGVS